MSYCPVLAAADVTNSACKNQDLVNELLKVN